MVSGSSIFMEKQQQFHRFVILLLWSKFLLFQAWNKYLHKKYWLPTKKRDLSCMVKKTNITHNIQSYINPLNVVQQLNSFNLKFIKHGSNMKFSLVAILVAFTCATVSIRLEFAKKEKLKSNDWRNIFLDCVRSTNNSKRIIRRIGSGRYIQYWRKF